jgi:hypothetical protein
MAKITNYSPRFDRCKTYAIGTLQDTEAAADTIPKFQKKPTPPIYIAGAELLGIGIRSVQEFLKSANCTFTNGKAVHFYEVEYPSDEGDDEVKYKHIYTGTPLLNPQNTGLSDDTPQATINGQPVSIQQIIPQPKQNSAENKEYIKSQGDQIKQLTEIAAKERREFANERTNFLSKIDTLNSSIVELNIRINTLQAEKRGLEIQISEKEKFIEQLTTMRQNEISPDDDEPKGLADKVGTVMSAIDIQLGDGASGQIAMQLFSQLGEGLNKLVDFGVDWGRKKANIPKPAPQTELQPDVQPVNDTAIPDSETVVANILNNRGGK